MRLWTIQNRSVLTAVEKGTWYSNLGYRNKNVDSDSDLTLRGRYPIYTYAMLDHDYLNIDTLRRSLKEILQQQRLPRDWGDVLVELEVSEEDILHMKPVDCQDYNSGFQFVSDYKVSMTEIIIACKKGESLYIVPRNMEAVIHRIKGSEIVAAHEFAVDKTYDTITLKTVYANDAVGAPAFCRPITLSTDGLFHIDRIKDADLAQVKNSYRDINTLVREKCSSIRPSEDMMVYEALNFVHDAARVSLALLYDEYEEKHPHKTMYDTRVRDIIRKD